MCLVSHHSPIFCGQPCGVRLC